MAVHALDNCMYALEQLRTERCQLQAAMAARQVRGEAMSNEECMAWQRLSQAWRRLELELHPLWRARIDDVQVVGLLEEVPVLQQQRQQDHDEGSMTELQSSQPEDTASWLNEIF